MREQEKGSGTTDTEDRRRQQLLAGTKSYQLGRFQATPLEPLFASESPGHTAVVFPRRSVLLHGVRGAARLTANRSTVVFHDQDSRYRREVLDPAGDDCIWLWARSDLLQEILGNVLEHRASTHPRFGFVDGPCPTHLFERQRALVTAVARVVTAGEPLDDLAFEEDVFWILYEAIQQAASHHATQRVRSLSAPPTRSVGQVAQEFLSAHYRATPKVAEIARAVGCSQYHLCREFRRHTGSSLHYFRTELRLRAAYDEILEGHTSLSQVAIDLGFSSHSHFTAAFRKYFGRAPSRLGSGCSARGRLA